MPEFRVTSFERGFTDNYVNGSTNAGQIFKNLLISRNRKPFSRPGSEIYDSDLSELPAGRQRIQHLKYYDNVLFEFTGDQIYYRDGTYKELTGPVDGNDAFGDIGSPSTSHNSVAVWQNHLYTSIDSYNRPRKIYKDEDGDWQIRNVGLPSPGRVRGFSTAVALANSLKTVMNAHFADVTEHSTAQDAIDVDDATDIDSLFVLCAALKEAYIEHESDARLSTPVYHKAQTSDDDSLPEETDIVTLEQAINLLNDIKTKYNLHDADSTAHTNGSQHSESTASATKSFTVTPDANDSKSYIYGICYKYEYKVGTVTYIDRSDVTEVEVTSAGNFSTTAHGNVLSNIPELSNDSFGTKESWDTDNIFIEIYRTADAGTVLQKSGQIMNGTTSYDDNIKDDDRGIVIYTDGGVVGREEPPPCKYLLEANDIMWYLNVKEDSEEKSFRVRHSPQNFPSSSPITFSVDLDSEIIGGRAIGINPIVFTLNKHYRFEGVVDSFGRGFVQKRVVDDTVGCVSNGSIVQVGGLLYFASIDGFYMTDGFRTRKISGHLTSSYDAIVSSETHRKRIYGVHDPINDRIYWALTDDAAGTENNAIWVHDLHWDYPNDEGSFTTYDFGANGQVSALEVIDGNLVRADARGYTFIHDDDIYTDPVIDVNESPSDWSVAQIIYDYVSCAYSFGSELQRKWVTKLLTVLKSVTNVSIQPYSINDDTGASRALKEIRNRSVFEWGDLFFQWGDPDFVWNAPGVGMFIRYFPRNGLRCTLKQVRYTNAVTVVMGSDAYGSLVIDTTADTATLESGQFADSDIGGFVLVIGGREFPITSATSTVISYVDAIGFLSDGVVSDWVVKGVRKGENFHLEGYTIQYEVFGSSHTAWRTGDSGENVG